MLISPESIRLLVITNSLEDDAPTRLAISILQAAQRRRQFVGGVFAMMRGGTMVEQLEASGVPYAVGGAGGGVAGLRSLLTSFRPHIVHFHLTRPALLGMPVALASRVPVTVVSHHGAHEWQEKGRVAGMLVQRAYPAVISHASSVVAVSHAARSELLAHGLNGSRVTVIHNGIDTMAFVPGTRHRQLQLISRYFPQDDADEILLIGCAGNLRNVKGHRHLIDSMVPVVRRVPAARLLLWGDGPERPALERQIQLHKLESVVRLVGHSINLPVEVAACHLFVQPSIQESFGLAAGEAMASGVPVVLSDAGGLPELGGEAALYVEPGSSESLAKGISSLLDNPGERAHLGMAGRNRILLHFSMEKMFRAHLDLYRRLHGESNAT